MIMITMIRVSLIINITVPVISVAKATLDSASEIISLFNVLRVNMKGSCTASGSRGSTAVLNVCTYNVRIPRTEDGIERSIDEVDQIK